MSILSDVKKETGLDISDDSFDIDLTNTIDTVFGILYQIGAFEEPVEFNKDLEWETTFTDTQIRQLAKKYIYLKVRNYFDPPSNSSLDKVYEERAKELEWRIYAVNNRKSE